MRVIPFVLILTLAAPIAADAQAQRRQRVPPSAQGSSNGGSQAQPREGARPRNEPPRRETPPPQRDTAPSRRETTPPRRETSPPAAANAPVNRDEQAQRRERRPPQNSSAGQAVPRPPDAYVDRRGNDGWRSYRNNPQVYVYAPHVYAPRSRVYGWIAPHRYYSYGYYYPYLYDYGPYGWAPFRGYGYGYPTGELRLDVQPTDAEVYIDGYYAGRVDEFDGVFQSLTLEEGTYSVEIVAPGYAPLVFDVRIYPGRKTTYRGDLLYDRQP